jgi:hypothetical protein
MKKLIGISAASLLALVILVGAGTAPQPRVVYAPDGQLKFPVDYREWVFLSSGVGMTYGPVGDAGRMGPPMFDNVFVNPESYREFVKTGHWPDKTMFVLEVRTSESHASINNDGHFQTGVMGIEAEVKDASAKSGEWTFYGFEDTKNPAAALGKPLPRAASCYSCHAKNTAVENTFVQFYPVLYGVAQTKHTLNAGFHELPIGSTELLDLIEEKGWYAGAAALDSAVTQSPGAAVLNVGSLGMVSSMLQPKHVTEAIALLKWTAGKHPELAIVQDGLADAYLTAGDKDAARSATKRELELAATDNSLTPAQRQEVEKAAATRFKKLE